MTSQHTPGPDTDLLEALQAMVSAYGSFASTPKANRCYPTQREVNQNQRVAMDRARAAIAKAAGGATPVTPPAACAACSIPFEAFSKAATCALSVCPNPRPGLRAAVLKTTGGKA